MTSRSGPGGGAAHAAAPPNGAGLPKTRRRGRRGRPAEEVAGPGRRAAPAAASPNRS